MELLHFSDEAEFVQSTREIPSLILHSDCVTNLELGEWSRVFSPFVVFLHISLSHYLFLVVQESVPIGVHPQLAWENWEVIYRSGEHSNGRRNLCDWVWCIPVG